MAHIGTEEEAALNTHEFAPEPRSLVGSFRAALRPTLSFLADIARDIAQVDETSRQLRRRRYSSLFEE
jgi:hypothetical protein